MDTAPSEKLIPIACRFVPYDQWLVTHVSSLWKIQHLKQWFLSKCLPNIDPPAVPKRRRSVSPITFASNRSRRSFESRHTDHSRYSLELSSDEETISDDYYGINGGVYVPRYRHTAKSSISSLSAGSQTPGNVAARYTLLTFSTGQILEDHFEISWYNLRPYELLELHNKGADLRLPRSILQEYVQPCFEAKARGFKIVWNAGRAIADTQFASTGKPRLGAAGIRRRIVKARSEEYLRRSGYASERDEGDRKKQKVSWRDKYVSIRQGIMTLYEDRTDANPLKFPLDKLTTLQGVEWLRMIATVPIDDVSGRILCCKFDSCPRGKSKRSPSDGSQDMLSNGASSGGCGNEESSNLGGAADRLSGEWIVLDMVEDDAFSALLRILHRSSSPNLRSVFLPTPSNTPLATPTSTAFTPPRRAPPETLISSRGSSLTGLLPYPEWRLSVVASAREAGVGVIGAAMKWVLWQDDRVLKQGGPSVSKRGRSKAVAPTRGGSGLIPGSYHGSGRSALAESTSSSDDTASDEDSSDCDSEAEWEGWSMDLVRQKRVEVLTCSQAPTGSIRSSKLYTMQTERRAMEPSAYVSSPSTNSSPFVTPPSSASLHSGSFSSAPSSVSPPRSPPLESPRPQRYRSTTFPRMPASALLEPTSTANENDGSKHRLSQSLSIGRELVTPAERDQGATTPTMIGGSIKRGDGTRSRTPSVSFTGRLWKGKGKEKDGSVEPSRAPTPQPCSSRPCGEMNVPQMGEQPPSSSLRHVHSSSSLRINPPARTGSPSVTFRTEPIRQKDTAETSRRSNSRDLVRRVSARAEKLMSNALDFVDPR